MIQWLQFMLCASRTYRAAQKHHAPIYMKMTDGYEFPYMVMILATGRSAWDLDQKIDVSPIESE